MSGRQSTQDTHGFSIRDGNIERQQIDCSQLFASSTVTQDGGPLDPDDIDNLTQESSITGLLERTMHFKKWYKRVHLGIMDVMLMNSYIGWNMAASLQYSRKRHLQRWEFYMAVAEQLLHFRSQANFCHNAELIATANTQFKEGEDDEPHVPLQCTQRWKRCWVCNLETSWMKVDKSRKRDGTMSNIVTCSHPKCPIIAHNFIPEQRENRFIHNMVGFKGKTCWMIAHEQLKKSDEHRGTGIFNRCAEGSTKDHNPVNGHEVTQELKRLHGWEPKKRRGVQQSKKNNKKANVGSESDDYEETDNERRARELLEVVNTRDAV